MKRAEHGLGTKGSDGTTATPVEAPQTGENPRDAREEPARQKQNQEELGVDEDHKTEDMKDTGRGTFP